MMTLTHKNVLFYSNHTIFEDGISSLISNEEEVRLTVVQASDVIDFVKTSREYQPDVIVVEQSLLGTQANFLNEMLDKMHSSCLITLDRNHNLMHVFTHCDISINQASDLIDVILYHINHSTPDVLKGEKNI
jgi:hypothetical protein